MHLSWDVDTAIKVGRRHGKVVVYKVDAKRMVDDGHDFYLSANNVWLIRAVPACYLSKLETDEKSRFIERC